MNKKNYLFKENATDMVYFCQVQVSNKFMKSVDAAELELLQWMRDTLAHRTCPEPEVEKALDELSRRVAAINGALSSDGRWLVLSWKPLTRVENGFVRIERTAGRHQNVLLPIIDCRGSVEI